jgi:hypothetical protein
MELLRAAKQLPKPQKARIGGLRSRWLHVFSKAFATFGHTNLCRRWMQYDKEVIHDVILVNQESEVPQNLVDAVKLAHGECVVLDPATPPLQRANDLRTFAWQNADVVVLHTHPDDILCTVAFGVEGGPPVLLLNHADHLFWTGCMIADLVLDIRASGHYWTEQVRGVDRAVILPIPLPEFKIEQDCETHDTQQRRILRRTLGIPEDANMLLTVGAPAKYRAIPGLDFVAAAREVIRECDNTYLVAIGPNDEGIWRVAKRATGGRILSVGYHRDSALFCRAADVYMEGFPLGSLTALLEAGLTGLPCVRAPRDCVPPFTTDSLSVEGSPQPKDVKDYIKTVVSLVMNPDSRVQSGLKMQEAIKLQHCGANWLMRLSTIKKQIPHRHSVYPRLNPACVAENMRDWFLSYLYSDEPSQTLKSLSARVFIQAWQCTNTRPRLDLHLWRELKASVPNNRSESGSTTVLGKYWDRTLLWRLNKRIQCQASYNKLMAGAEESFRTGQCSLARKMIYRCIIANPACLFDVDWLKLFVKVNIGKKLTSRLRKILAYRASHFRGR